MLQIGTRVPDHGKETFVTPVINQANLPWW